MSKEGCIAIAPVTIAPTLPKFFISNQEIYTNTT